MTFRFAWLLCGASLALATNPRAYAVSPPPAGSIYDVRAYGAVGDGRTDDTAAINRAIEDAAAHGGGTVRLPAGTYASYSIRLRSNLSFRIEAGATLMAAEPTPDFTGAYDPAEPNPADAYQDFGHSHWHNSLIWGEDLENVTLSGPGHIYGFGLSRGLNPSDTVRDPTPEEIRTGRAVRAAPHPIASGGPPNREVLAAGIGNKAIALKRCRNVTLQGLTIYHGGHLAVLATGVDNLVVENLTIDTNRDGLDIDSCRNVRVSDCLVNTPRDDGICLKSDYALGVIKPCENVVITNCMVSGFDEGTVLDGTYRTVTKVSRNGRIKLGTETTGGFRNIAISNCVFDTSLGLAIEEVDGAALEDVSISNLTMRNISNAAIYVRLGARNRGPAGTVTGSLRRLSIDHLNAWNVDPRYSSIIAGVPGHPIDGVRLSQIRIAYQGGGTAQDALIVPPEVSEGYPDPRRHGTMPAYGFFIRHVSDLAMDQVQLSYVRDEARPALVLDDVAGARFDHLEARHSPGTPVFVLHQVTDFETN